MLPAAVPVCWSVRLSVGGNDAEKVPGGVDDALLGGSVAGVSASPAEERNVATSLWAGRRLG